MNILLEQLQYLLQQIFQQILHPKIFKILHPKIFKESAVNQMHALPTNLKQILLKGVPISMLLIALQLQLPKTNLISPPTACSSTQKASLMSKESK